MTNYRYYRLLLIWDERHIAANEGRLLISSIAM